MNRVILSTVLIALTGLAGCGGGAEGGKPVFPVTGSVTLLGGPLADATIAFAPTVAGQPTAMGKTDKEGNFTLTTYEYGDGAAEGTFKVVISKTVYLPTEVESSGGESGHEGTGDTGDSHAAAMKAMKAGKGGSESLVPEVYGSSSSTPLSKEVASSGPNVFNFELK